MSARINGASLEPKALCVFNGSQQPLPQRFFILCKQRHMTTPFTVQEYDDHLPQVQPLLTLYCGSMMWLKHVCAVGKRPPPGPLRAMVNGGDKLARPLMGTRSLPVVKNNNRFFCSTGISPATSQNHRTVSWLL